jgi:(S)-2-hydroxyglutarate dehydrogenase
LASRLLISSFSKAAFVSALQRLVPDLQSADLAPGDAGVRAQAVDRGGKLVDDFRLTVSERAVHVLNVPSPAATASIVIGRENREASTRAPEAQRALAAVTG